MSTIRHYGILAIGMVLLSVGFGVGFTQSPVPGAYVGFAGWLAIVLIAPRLNRKTAGGADA